MKLLQAIFGSAVVVLPLVLSGCSADFSGESYAPGTEPGAAIHGQIEGGQQAITGAHVFLLELNSTAVASGTAPIGGYGGRGVSASATNASKSLLIASTGTYPTTLDSTSGSPTNGDYYVTSGSYGQFGITGDYACDSGAYVYLYVSGGNPGLTAGTNNSAIGELTPLGLCGSFGASTSVYINEVTTVATAYALAGFATDALHIGSTPTSLAKTGLANAFANISNMVDATSMGAAYANHNLAFGGTATIPQQTINSLANILAACINTSGPSSTACSTLFADARSGGGTAGTAPADTATAMINIAHYPGLSTMSALYGLQTGVSSPFTPALSSLPKDFSLQITYTGGGLTPQYTNGQDIAADATGNIWVTNGQGTTTGSAGTTVSKFSPLGVAPNSTGYSASGVLNMPYGSAISADSGHLWVANYGNGSVVDINMSTGAGTEHSLPNGEGPSALAFDSSGNIWGIDDNNNYLFKVNSSGTQTNYYSGNGLNGPFDLAVGATSSGKIWVANGGSGDASVFSSSGGAVSNPGHPVEPTDVALDSAGNAWFVTTSDGTKNSGGFTTSLWMLPANGTTAGTSYALPNAPGTYIWSDVIDGANNIWIAGQSVSGTANNQVWGVDSSGNILTGASQGLAPSPISTQPCAIAVDQSGNVWYTSCSDSTLHVIVGAGVPVVVPISVATANNTLGTRP